MSWLDIRALDFSCLAKSKIDTIISSVEAALEELKRKKTEAVAFERVLAKFNKTGRNEGSHNILFKIRYNDSQETHPLQAFLKELPIGAFLRLIFKLSYGDLMSIPNHLDHLAWRIRLTKLDLRHSHHLIKLEGYDVFLKECEAGNSRYSFPIRITDIEFQTENTLLLLIPCPLPLCLPRFADP
jgi:hypothetical protein